MKLYSELIYVLVASFGGIAKQLNIVLSDEGTQFNFYRLFARAVVGGFSGYMFAEAISIVQPTWDVFAAGIGGWLGADGLDFLATILKRKMGSNGK